MIVVRVDLPKWDQRPEEYFITRDYKRRGDGETEESLPTVSNEFRQWCKENGIRFAVRWLLTAVEYEEIVFPDVRSAVAFKLRWL